MSIIGRALNFISTARTYATWDPSNKGSGITLSNGNLTASSTAIGSVRSTIGKPSGKWYWEITATNGNNDGIGVADVSASLSGRLGNDAHGYAYWPNGALRNNSTSTTGFPTYTDGDIISVLLDLDAGTVGFYKNGTDIGGNFGVVAGTYYAAVGPNSSSSVNVANFGASAFTYSAPAGYNAGLYN